MPGPVFAVGWSQCSYQEQLSVDAVICFLEVDEAHVQGDFPRPSEFLQSAHDEQDVDCRTCWAKTALLLWEYPPDLEVVAESGR